MGAIQNVILEIANTNADRGKVSFRKGMARFARVEVLKVDEIDSSDASKYGIVDQEIVGKAKDAKYKYVIMAYFKIPKQQAWKEGGKSTWKGTPGYEGFTEDNMKEAFLKALPAGEDLFEFKKYEKTANEKFTYNATKVPADTCVYVGFANALQGVEPPPDSGKMYFAVSENRESPDPTKIKDWLNDKKSVKQDEVNDDLLNRLKEAAVATLSDDERGKLEFDGWEPDPKADGKSPNGKDPDGNDGAVVVCAKFKKKGGGDPDKEVYFAVSKKRDNPDPKDVDKWLNDSKPVKVADIKDDLLARFKDEAVAALSDEEKSKLGFKDWVPDPTKVELLVVNGKTPDGSKDAIVVCAKFADASSTSGSDKRVYFAVSENRETPDPAKIEEWLNDSKPVALSALTDDMLEQFKA